VAVDCTRSVVTNQTYLCLTRALPIMLIFALTSAIMNLGYKKKLIELVAIPLKENVCSLILFIEALLDRQFFVCFPVWLIRK